jgi:glycosyltransferase involved in cell wall biosynthesis
MTITTNNPKISIIVATYNAGNALKKTLESISSQKYDNMEIVVIDGGSKDNTLEIVQEFNEKIAYFISEKDKGIPDAYNKGILAATGDWIYFLNADDIFHSDTVISEVFSRGKIEEQLIVGQVISDQGRIFKDKFSWRLLLRNQVHHQAILYESKFIKGFPYNNAYKRYGHDYEHNIEVWKKNVSVHYVDKIIAIWASGGISDSANWKDYKEEFKVRKNSLGILGIFFDIFTVIRFFIKYAKRQFMST